MTARTRRRDHDLDDRTLTSHARPPGFDPKACQLCGRPLRDHAIGEFCRRPDLPTSPPARDRVPVHSKEFQIMSKTATWVDQAAKDLNLDTHRPCGMCKGKGKIPKKPTRTAVNKAIGYSSQSAAQLASSLADPPLSRLLNIAEALGGVSLEDAVAWCKALAKRIEAEG